MPRHRGTREGAATLIGKLLLLIAAGKETSTSLGNKLAVSPRQVNRYVLQLIAAGWQIERVGAWTKADYWFELKSPRIILAKESKAKRRRREQPSQ